MNIRRVLFVFLLLLSLMVLKPNSSYAADLKEIFTSGDSFVVRVVEGIEYIFTFRAEKKIEVLEKHAERKLELAREYAENGEEEKVQNMLQRYERIRERLGKVVGENLDGDVLGSVEERVVNQQATIEEIKGMVGTTVKDEIIEVQEKVVNDVAGWVVDVNGPEGQTEFFQKVEHVWAPGTGPGGGESGVVIEGGEMMFAPGTENGGPGGVDIQDVVIEGEGNASGGGGESVVVN